MFAILLLLGMVPFESQVRSGPPAPPLAQEAARQWRLSARSSWQVFLQRWGGRWAVRWDERNGTPRFLYTPGVALERDDALVASVAELAGIDPSEMHFSRATRRYDGQRFHEIRQWQRSWHGASVFGDQIAVVSVDDRIDGVWAQLTPVHLDEPLPGEIVFPMPVWGPGGEGSPPSRGVEPMLVRKVTGRAARVDDTVEGHDVAFFDRQGHEVYRYDQRLPSTVQVSHYERTVLDDHVTDPAREVTVTDAAGSTAVTDDDGNHLLTGPLSVELTGPNLVVLENFSGITVTGSDDVLLEGGTDISDAAATVLDNFHVVWDWLGVRWPSISWLDEQVWAVVDMTSDYCNASYWSDALYFLVGYPGYCANFGEIADVVYHEMGHGVHEHVLAAGTFSSDVSEGSGDYLSATINDDPELAPGAWADGSPVREIETDKVYPTDYTGESHADGLIWGSFMWDLREQWADSMGDAAGVEASDLLFLGTLEQGPSLTDVYEAVIVADDDNGDLSDGTPHACELKTLLDAHGLGPGPIGGVDFAHVPLGQQSSFAESYEVDFVLSAVFEDCSDFDPSSVQLWFSTDDAPVPGTAEASATFATKDTDEIESATTYPGWTSVKLVRKGSNWTGAIPRQLATTHVRYFMQASTTDRSQTVYTHGGYADQVYSFYVGDTEEIWCEGFESGAADWHHGTTTPDWTSGSFTDQWTFGRPAGTYAYDPRRAWEGANIATTVLDGAYSPMNAQHLTSPTIDLAGAGPMLLLQYHRWLTVEDGIYDHARLWANGTIVYENRATAEGTNQTLDEGWTQVDVPLDEVIGDDGTVAFTWALQSDPGLEFGGWAIDDVCVVDLADLPGHYRVHDLVASDDLDDRVEVTFSEPWIAPLSATVLMRKEGAFPTGPDDGTVLSLDEAAVPGAARSYTDVDVKPGVTYYYAVFSAADSKTGWITDLVEGQNADTGGLRVPVDTGDTADSGSDSAGDTAREGPDRRTGPNGTCGCASPVTRGGQGWLFGLLLAGLSFRRKPR
jgi:hypothetical protein